MTPVQLFPLSRDLFASVGSVGSRRTLAEPSLCYDPPYERVSDDQLAWFLVRHLHPGTELTYREAAQTTIGTFVLDFVASRGQRRIGFVLCDPDEDAAVRQDPAWHAMVLSTGVVDTLYCVAGSRLDERVVDVLSVIAGWQPEMFSPDGLAELASRATDVSASLRVCGTGSEVCLDYSNPVEDCYRDVSFTWPSREIDEVRVSRRSMAPLTSAASRARFAPVQRVA